MGGVYRGRHRRMLPLGTISEGTIQPSDLLEAFLSAAEGIHLRHPDRIKVDGIRREADRGLDQLYREEKKNGADLEADGTIDEIRNEHIEALTEILNQYCPDYTYFGVHERDGALFGVWTSDDVPFHTGANDEIGKGDTLPLPRTVKQGYYLVVNDHGNCTLYHKQRAGKGARWKEVWSVV